MTDEAVPPDSEEAGADPGEPAGDPAVPMPAASSASPINLGAPEHPASGNIPEREDYNPAKARDITRTYIAGALIVVTAAIIVGAFVMSAWALGPEATLEDNRKTILALLNVVFGPVIALLGSVIGFYFGAGSGTNQTGGSR